ncbi:MAG: STAS domain-containing protein [Acidobacteriaceae bacterium]
MPVTFDRSEAAGVVRLEGDIDIASAAQLKEVLLEALAQRGEARISLETATGIDVTAVQLLWAAEREAKASGVVMALQGPVPETLRATLREAGFESFPFTDDGEPAKGARE